MKRLFISLLGGVLMLGWLFTTAPHARAASCGSSYAVCMYANSHSGGAVLRIPKTMCFAYVNLTAQGFNDVTSSIDNWVNHTQSFWVDANFKGAKYNLGPYKYAATLPASLNDRISSTTGIG